MITLYEIDRIKKINNNKYLLLYYDLLVEKEGYFFVQPTQMSWNHKALLTRPYFTLKVEELHTILLTSEMWIMNGFILSRGNDISDVIDELI
jgi:hypothetical protein